MTRLTSIAVASRVICLATVVGLALAFGMEETRDGLAVNDSLRGSILLAVVSGCAILADVRSPLRGGWITVAEGTLAALIIGQRLPDSGAMLLPYLLIPALLAGIESGLSWALAVVIAEILGLVVVHLPPFGSGIVATVSTVAPWVIAVIGSAVLGAWLRQVRLSHGEPVDHASYEDARRLLSQLRIVARRLSSGLDPVSMADQLLLTVHRHLNDTHAAVFVRTEGGLLAPLGYRGYAAREKLLPEGPVIDACWAETEPAHVQQPRAPEHSRYRVALPLRSGSRMIGVVLADMPEAPPPRALSALMREYDESALRLDTALVFDEVRTLATTEERQRLAREIHDGVAQEVASLGYIVDDIGATDLSEEQRSLLHSLRGEITRVVSELRLSIFDLRSETTPSAGLGSALSDYVRAVGARSGLTVHLVLDEAPTRLRGEVETELLRIAQEAITNARKHSKAKNLWVDCRIHPPFAHISVRDDGAGLGTGRADSYGLKIMRERAHRIHATLDIGPGTTDTEDGVAPGTTVSVTVAGPVPVSP